MKRVTLKGLVGFLSGLFGWAIIEPTRPANAIVQWAFFELKMAAVVGILVGLALGGLNGWYRGTRRALIEGLVLGAIFGGIGILIGYSIGAAIAQPFAGSTTWPQVALFRIPAITGIGLGLGFGIGASTLNWRRTVQGAIGGTIGGAIAGALFDPIAISLQNVVMTASQNSGVRTVETGSVSRAVTFALLGMMVGVAIGFVERLARKAWLVHRVGRNEGREYPLDAIQNIIGRDERAQIPLFADPNVSSAHAVIIQNNRQYEIRDMNSALGTYVNGARVGAAFLQPGSVIQIGSYALEFHSKDARRTSPVSATPAQATAPTQPIQLGPAAAPGPAPATPFVVLVNGPLAGQRFPVTSNLEIGREASGIPLSYDSQASRRHAVIELASSGLTIRDLGSTNGTFVNGSKVASAAIPIGSTFQIGSTIFRVE